MSVFGFARFHLSHVLVRCTDDFVLKCFGSFFERCGSGRFFDGPFYLLTKVIPIDSIAAPAGGYTRDGLVVDRAVYRDVYWQVVIN